MTSAANTVPQATFKLWLEDAVVQANKEKRDLSLRIGALEQQFGISGDLKQTEDLAIRINVLLNHPPSQNNSTVHYLKDRVAFLAQKQKRLTEHQRKEASWLVTRRLRAVLPENWL